MTWLGDCERSDPAYPGHPGDVTTTSWSKLDAQELRDALAAEDAAEDKPRARYAGRHRKPRKW